MWVHETPITVLLVSRLTIEIHKPRVVGVVPGELSTTGALASHREPRRIKWTLEYLGTIRAKVNRAGCNGTASREHLACRRPS